MKRNSSFSKERSAKISAASKGKIITVEMRSKISHTKKLQFADPKFKEAVLAKFWASCKKRPTSFEKQILTLIREKSLPFEYVGDGKLLIGCKNPDFIDTFGGHLIIETYYRALHPRDYEKTRKQYF